MGDPFVPPTPGPGETCFVYQECKGRGFLHPMSLTTCNGGQPPGTSDVLNPELIWYKPRAIYKDEQKAMIRQNCPDFDPDTPLCCNDD